VREAFATPADVVLLASGCVMAEGWLEGLTDAAASDSRIATVSALPFAAADGFDEAAANVRAHSLRLRPRLERAFGPCIYVRRSALELVGPFDPTDGADAARFYRRCIESSLLHVLADDVLVLGGAPLAEDSAPIRRSLSRVRRTLSRPSVAIDARILSRRMTGTELQVLEVIAALARSERVRVTAVMPEVIAPYAARALDALPGLDRVRASEAPGIVRADLVHRPYQVGNPGDLALLASLGERLVLTNQDLISYHNPSYFEDGEAWQGYRRLTRLALTIADHVVFVSAHGRDDAIVEDLVEPGRTSVVHNGVEHVAVVAAAPPAPGPAASRLPGEAEVILCLGTDYRHKNRVFALRTLEALQRRHNWRGHLVFAGPNVDRGSSRPQEAEMLAGDPRLASAVIDCGAVSEAEKAWLLRRARLVAYPTTYEGFGLVPFEAAAQRVPCLWAPGTSLSEVLPDSAAEIVPWSAELTAERALALLRNERARDRQLALIREAAHGLTWDAAAAALVDLYCAVCDGPATPATVLERGHGVMSGAISEDAMRLVGPGGALARDMERALLALAMHPRLGAPVFGAIKLGYRASFRARRWRRGRT